ncbi:MAG: ParB/RepB/Spo0J family partition protein [Ruminococcaceae bacterium]|nr:ParB/RepB/Spo0J family partition protein [Oscillospiraceae bacterium]
MKDSKNEKSEQAVLSLPISDISKNPNQPRKVFNEDAIIKLADSIRQHGFIQPLVVRQISNGYELISGERRLRAAEELAMTHVPCIINKASESESAEMAIIENLIREDLNIFEEAEAIEALIDTHSLTQEEIASRLSASQSYIANKLRLLRLSKDEREVILKNKLTERHARALIRLQDDKIRAKALNEIVLSGLNVSKTEELIDKLRQDNKETKEEKKPQKSISSFLESLSRAIEAVENSGYKVKSRKIESEEYTEITLVIPKSKQATELS